MKKYYKIVDSNLRSCTVGYFSGVKHHSVQYKLNEFVSSKNGGPLLVFDSLNSARRFIGAVAENSKIYECEVTRPRKIKYLVYLNYGYDSIKEFLESKRKKQIINKKIRFMVPQGTVAVDSVKLIKQVPLRKTLV